MRTIDAIVVSAASRDLSDLDPEVSAVLQIAVGEMLSDEEGSTYATVNESVEAVKQLGKTRASGLVNGVLRSLAREGMPDMDGDRARDFSVPEWVLGMLTRDHGRGKARELLAGLRRPPPGIGIRVRPGGHAPDGAVAVPGIADSYTLSQRPETSEGLVVTDAASSAVAQAVAAQPGESILDMAAAPGGKTIGIWDQVRGEGAIVAMDAHARRLRSAADRFRRAGVGPTLVQGDGGRAPFRNGSFDAVLLDAPCTGLGTLRRRPEIAMRLKTKQQEALVDQQRQLLAEAYRITKSGGRVVYSVCTMFAVETVDVIADYDAGPPQGLPGEKWGKGLLLAPHLTGTDGMFVSTIRR
jgi:16S rRNA (cytosine967-C5)-methyltransferase